MLKFEVIPVTQFAQNCSLIWCDETHQAALIDPGGEADKLLAAIAKRGLTLTHILLTHGHLDHVGAAAELREKPGWPSPAPTKRMRSGSTCCPSRARCSASPIPPRSRRITGLSKVTR
jgi:glyoxylase-like metal-dependent hydrolase (beta-lactamase superfamily II)